MIQLEIFRRIMLKGSGVQPRVIAPTNHQYIHISTHMLTLIFLNSTTLLEILEERRDF